MPQRISLRHTDFFKEIQRYLTTMHGNQVPVIELSLIDNFSDKLSINLDTKVRNNDSITKIWLCKVMSEKRGWQVTKSPPLNPPLGIIDLSDDMEKNPGPKYSSSQNFSIYHWNLNSLTAHSYVNTFVLKAYLSIHKFDIICLSKICLVPSCCFTWCQFENTGLRISPIKPPIAT